MNQARAHYTWIAAFIPRPLRKGMKIFEDINLLESQPCQEQLMQ
jgi:hypothetical protein